MKDHMDFFFDTPIEKIEILDNGDYRVDTKDNSYDCKKCVISSDEVEVNGWKLSAMI